jgi:hypothetical protein
LIEQRHAGAIEPVEWNAANDAAALEAGCGGAALHALRLREAARRVIDSVEGRAVLIERLGKIALALERRREPVVRRRAGARARLKFLAVEEEKAVLSARLPDGSANGVTPVRLVDDRLGDPVLPVGPAVGIPLRVALDVIEGAVELVGPALGDGRNLQTARAVTIFTSAI